MTPQPNVLQAPVVVSSVQDFDALMSRQGDVLTLDFSATTLTRPAGMVGLLAVLDWQLRQQNGQRVDLLLPQAPPVCAGWQAVGLMDALAEFCHWSADPVENMNSAYSPVKPLVNCVHFRDSSAVERMLEEMENRFMVELAGYSSLLQSCCGIFSELTANTIYHADSNGGFALAQYCECDDRPVIELTVADSGIGIRNSLAKNPALVGIDSDCAAIRQAMTEGVLPWAISTAVWAWPTSQTPCKGNRNATWQFAPAMV